MSCGCKTKHPDGFETMPREPCIYCAEKHLSTAFALANELGYEKFNRQYIIGELVLAQWHLKEHILEALKIRDIRHLVQQRKEKEVKWDDALSSINELIEKSIEETKTREQSEERKKANQIIDIIVPLGEGSKSNDDELKLFLRSLEKNVINYNKVWIVATKKPEWLKENNKLEVLYKDDSYKHNKDANLFEKVKYAMEKSTADTVIFSADDCAILQNYNLSLLPPIYNKRGVKEFENNDSKWRRRMFATLKELNMTNGNFDSHTPQPFDRIKALKIIDTIPYDAKEGRCIDTAILGRVYNSSIPKEAVEQSRVKITAESKDIENLKFDKLFIGYNDNAFLNGLREKLFELFPTPSQWEIFNDITVLTAGRQETLESWLKAWVNSPSFGKFKVMIGDDGFSKEFKNKIDSLGITRFDMKPINSKCVERYGKKYSVHHSMWSSKVLAIQQCPTHWCFWMDHDVEVCGDITPIIEYALKQNNWLAAPKYESMGQGRFKNRRITQNGIMIVNKDSPNIKLWEEGMLKLECPNDETCIHRIFGGWDNANNNITDLYKPEWYSSVDCLPEINIGVYPATEKLKTVKSILRHWCSRAGKLAFHSIWGNK